MFGVFALAAPHAPAAPRIVTAAEVNGTWRNENGTFKVWALGRQRLKVEFFGSMEGPGGVASTGEARGIAHIEGDTAVLEPAGVGRCRITMKFERAKLAVDQDGTCGFGLNVNADGTYVKKNRSKPRFAD
jgi:hypothetical protein